MALGTRGGGTPRDLARLRLGAQVSIGCCDQANVDFSGTFFADPFEFAFLQDAQQLGLQFKRDLADLVEKERPAFGKLKASNPIAHRPREGTFCVAEELAFVQFPRHLGAVDFDERPFRPLAAPMDLPGDEFLAGAALSQDEHGRFGRRHQVDLPEDGFQRRALADAASELLRDVFGEETASSRLVFGVASLLLGSPVELEVILEVKS